MPQIPVAVFMTSFDPGGTERQMTELIRRLDAGRYRVHAVCFRREGAWLPRVVERAASVVDFPIHGFARPSTLRQAVRFARWCRRERIAAVHTCDFYSNVFGLPAARLAGVRVRIGSRRELNPDKSDRQIRLQRLAYRCATRVVANSPSAASVLVGEGLDAARVTVIPNGLDSARYADRPGRDAIRRVVCVANLRPEKNHETLIGAAALLKPRCPGLRYRIVGGGARRAALETLARDRGVADVVEFAGHRDDIPAELREADVFVLPSRSEAFPNSVLEAMAAGLPVVASAVGGLLDLVEHGRTGLLVPVADPEALADALHRLYAEPARAHALGDAARRGVGVRYSFERMVGAFQALYESELEAHHVLEAQTAQAGI